LLGDRRAAAPVTMRRFTTRSARRAGISCSWGNRLARSRHRRTDQRSRKRAAPAPNPLTSEPLSGVPRLSRTRTIIAVAAIAAAIFAGGITWQILTGQSAPDPHLPGADAGVAAYVGSQTCAGCHQPEADLWRVSQHKHAMDHANDRSVLGDFNNARFDYHGARSRFFRKEGKFFVETDGRDGKLATFQIKYTFGVYPLQQYLIAVPDGRIQALSVAWDSRPKEKGGQHWFHLYPKEDIRYDDILHWTKLNQNWNHMCAECHSTGVRKNYDAISDRFATTWAEISVGCEACHGPGSRHVAWAQAQKSWWPYGKAEDPNRGFAVRFNERQGVSWLQNPRTRMPQRSAAPALLRKEVETCGRCHARRSEFSEKWVPGRWLSDTHEVAPLGRRFFYADGQMRDDEETYSYAAFKQSKMFAKGVTCSDCHDPHSAALRVPGDGACVQCHTSGKYETADHSHHVDVAPSVNCTSCHMRAYTYMVIDRRHDHSFRIPRPDLSVKLGIPNACNACHADKSAQWAATAVERWFGPHREGFQSYAEAFHAAWTDQPNAEKLLSAVASNGSTPAFVRASALSELSAYVSRVDVGVARMGLSNQNPMVRIGALDMLDSVPADRLWPLVSPLLSDPVRGVRIKAVSVLAAVPMATLPPEDRRRFERAAAEFVAAQQLNADRPEARSALGTFYAQRGLVENAEAEITAALRLSPQFAPAAINLADLYRELGRDREGADVLRRALVGSPQDAGLHYALGLALVRLKHNSDALAELRRATELAPDQSRYAYVYAVGLHSAGRSADAISILKESLARHPSDRDTLIALVVFNRDIGNAPVARNYAERLLQVFPTDKEAAQILEELNREVK
jgi:predicted CXXCH cytochrome family protein